MLPEDMVLVPLHHDMAPRQLGGRKRQPMFMLNVTHTGDVQICKFAQDLSWTCPLHSFVGHRGLFILVFAAFSVSDASIRYLKGTPSRASISQSGLSPLNPLWGPQGQIGNRGKAPSTSWVQDQPQEGVTPLPISSVARSSKRSLSCAPCTSHCRYLC